MENKLAVRLLGALAHEVRLSVFRLLVEAGPEGLAAGEIALRLDIAASSLSFHLKELHHAGLIGKEQRSRMIFYFAHFEAMNELIAYLTENCCQGEVECALSPLSEQAEQGRRTKEVG